MITSLPLQGFPFIRDEAGTVHHFDPAGYRVNPDGDVIAITSCGDIYADGSRPLKRAPLTHRCKDCFT